MSTSIEQKSPQFRISREIKDRHSQSLPTDPARPEASTHRDWLRHRLPRQTGECAAPRQAKRAHSPWLVAVSAVGARVGLHVERMRMTRRRIVGGSEVASDLVALVVLVVEAVGTVEAVSVFGGRAVRATCC